MLYLVKHDGDWGQLVVKLAKFATAARRGGNEDAARRCVLKKWRFAAPRLRVEIDVPAFWGPLGWPERLTGNPW